MVIKDNIKNLLLCIMFVLLLLGVCVSNDYADTNITISNKENLTSNLTFDNNVSVIGVNETSGNFVVKSNDKIHTKYSTIGMYAKPSCGCRYSYKYWYYREFVNYCPNCHHYNVLCKNPKCTFEREYSCARCDSDFCGVCGKEKYSWSRVYLRSIQ